MEHNRNILLNFLFITLLTLVCISCSPLIAEATETSLYESTTHKTYKKNGDRWELLTESYCKMNAKGLVTSWKWLDHSSYGTFEVNGKCKYDKKGNLLEEKEEKRSGGYKNKCNTKYKYNKKGKLLEVRCDGKMSEKYIYNKSGKLLSYKYYDYGQLSSTTTYQYKKGKMKSSEEKDTDGNCTEKSIYDSRGNIKKAVVYYYDSFDNILAVDKINYKYSYKNGILKKETCITKTYNADGTLRLSSTEINEYYTSGYRKGLDKKNFKHEEHENDIWTNIKNYTHKTIFTYKKSGKRTIIGKGKTYTDGELCGKEEMVYKMLNK